MTNKKLDYLRDSLYNIQGHSRSRILVQNENPYILYYTLY